MNRFSRFGELPVYYYFTFNNRRSVGACHSRFSSVVALISALFPMGPPKILDCVLEHVFRVANFLMPISDLPSRCVFHSPIFCFSERAERYGSKIFSFMFVGSLLFSLAAG